MKEKKNITLSGYPAKKVVITHDEITYNRTTTGQYDIITTYLISTPNHFYYIHAGFHESTIIAKYQSELDGIVNSFIVLQ